MNNYDHSLTKFYVNIYILPYKKFFLFFLINFRCPTSVPIFFLGWFTLLGTSALNGGASAGSMDGGLTAANGGSAVAGKPAKARIYYMMKMNLK